MARNNRILILGKGYLGTYLHRATGFPLCGLKIRSSKDINHIFKTHNYPDVLINAIGYHGRVNIDDCDRTRDKTFQSNATVPTLLAMASRRYHFRLVHLSSGCIFHYRYGSPHITETREPDFYDTFYARTKILAEQAVQGLCLPKNFLILRIRLPLDSQPHPFNLLTKVLGFKAVVTEPQSVTYLPDLAKAIRHLIAINASGVFHVINPGKLSYPQLLETYRKYRPEHPYQTTTSNHLRQRRANVLLSCQKLEMTGFRPRDISVILEPCIQDYLSHVEVRP